MAIDIETVRSVEYHEKSPSIHYISNWSEAIKYHKEKGDLKNYLISVQKQLDLLYAIKQFGIPSNDPNRTVEQYITSLFEEMVEMKSLLTVDISKEKPSTLNILGLIIDMEYNPNITTSWFVFGMKFWDGQFFDAAMNCFCNIIYMDEEHGLEFTWKLLEILSKSNNLAMYRIQYQGNELIKQILYNMQHPNINIIS
ncbi:MAG: hypothetical protein ACXAD7_15005 [Candidatus Kariarchaeaceae archaeon]|jgi:hypothetical protein